ncbi:flippase [Methanospirillum stamsii]|uniref:Uncharacterized protein n=1 Tax=Methanospirillum stamsii TaxID=1277351 RepID=A0A2V2N9D5_9EURY|nr:flippase [Methanospirillum stamsii]PWR72917.1 hypothetical protein DLD82_11655 [Methanospirillum stamsii]
MIFISRFFQNVGSLLLGQIFAFIIGFFQMIYLARILGPDSFGVMNYALVITSYVTIISNLGLPLHGTRHIARGKILNAVFFWNITTLRLILSVMCILVTSIMLWFVYSQYRAANIMILFLLTAIPTILIPDWVYNGLEKMAINSLVKVIIASLSFVLIIIFVDESVDLIYVPLIQAISIIGGLSIGYLPLWNHIFSVPIVLTPEKWFACIVSSISIGITNILSLVMTNLDTLIIGLFMNPVSVGYYSAASRIISSFSTLLGLVLISLFPALCRSLEKWSKQSSQYIPSILSGICFLGIPVCLFFSWNAYFFINVIYREQYASSILIWQILIWSIIPLTLNSIYAWSMWASDRDAVYIWVLLCSISTLILLLVVGIHMIGLTGAAVAIVFSGIISMIYHVYPLRDILPFPVKSVLGMFLITIFTLVVVHLLQQYFLFPVSLVQIFGISTFFVLTVCGGFIKLQDIYSLLNMILKANLMVTSNQK